LHDDATVARVCVRSATLSRLSLSILVFSGLAGFPGCGRGKSPAGSEADGDVRAFVSLERVDVRAEAAAGASRVSTLTRGTEVRLKGQTGGFARIVLSSGREGWIPSGSIERVHDRADRKVRTDAVARFPVQPGRVLESTIFFLSPDYGAAQFAPAEEGAALDVVLADHDFFGVLLPGKVLAFVPARSVRLIAAPPESRSEAPPPSAVHAPPVALLAGVETPPEPIRVTSSSAPFSPDPAPGGPYESLPPDATAPLLVTRVDPKYPDFAKKAGRSGDVQLRILVEKDGRVSRVDVVTGAPGGMTEAARDAVRRWAYEPARIAGQPVAVWKVVRVHFSVDGKGPRGDEPPPL
jgi:protein TonB